MEKALTCRYLHFSSFKVIMNYYFFVVRIKINCLLKWEGVGKGVEILVRWGGGGTFTC